MSVLYKSLGPARRVRCFSSTVRRWADSEAYKAVHSRIQEQFVLAKDEYELALESAGTTYAAEDNELARAEAKTLSAVWETHATEDGAKEGGLSQDERQRLRERLGARIRELLNGVEHNLHDH
ncbi:hypothetical protein PYCC9005_000060 [Savitreella phatthalungensis]